MPAISSPLFRAALIAAIAAAAPAAAQDSSAPAKPEWPKTVYACHQHSNFEEFGGMLDFDITYFEDGSVVSEGGRWTAIIEQRKILGAPKANAPDVGGPERGSIVIEWPKFDPWLKEKPADPMANATINISNHALFTQKMTKQERWHQAVVARGSEVLVNNTNEYPILWLSPLEPALVTDYDGPGWSPFSMSFANLVAWGGGLDRLTVYDVFVQPRKYKPNSFPNGPAGIMRIIGEYQLDILALTSAFAGIRERHDAWRKSIVDFRASCDEQQMDDPSMEIIVT
jgi:hypothetical protein